MPAISSASALVYEVAEGVATGVVAGPSPPPPPPQAARVHKAIRVALNLDEDEIFDMVFATKKI